MHSISFYNLIIPGHLNLWWQKEGEKRFEAWMRKQGKRKQDKQKRK
jgi:hypothetical protein